MIYYATLPYEYQNRPGYNWDLFDSSVLIVMMTDSKTLWCRGNLIFENINKQLQLEFHADELRSPIQNGMGYRMGRNTSAREFGTCQHY